jgi:hypothetical protein
MTTRQYSSRSQQSTLTGSITSVDATMTVVSGSALLGGQSIPGGTTFTLVIDPDTALEEIVDATSVATNTFAITRSVDTVSGAQAHSAGAAVRHMAIGRDFREANTHIEALRVNSATAHGIPLDTVVLTSDTGTVDSTMIANNTIVDGDINSAAGISDTKLNTISTALKVANSATTATSANTASAIVARDGSGNFTAGTVTASLIGSSTSTSGNAATATALATPRALSLTGDVTATGVNFDGTAAVALTTAYGAGSIDNADINASAAIAYSKLDLNGTITSADIVDGTIVNTDINASAAIALSKLAVDPLARANHTGTQTASTVSDFDTQVRTSRLEQMAAPIAALPLNAQKITGLADPIDPQDAVTLNYITTEKGAVNGIASLDGSGLVPTAQLPALAITNTSVVASQVAMLALTAQIGDIAVRTDLNKSFILTATPSTSLVNWQELLTPTDSVLSVDGNTGVVSLSGTYLNKTTGQLLGNLDANSFTVSGLAAPVSSADAATKVYVDAVAGSATAAAASAAAAASSYDDFDDRYLGPKATPPTLDNDGNPLGTGALYWNTVTSEMYAWTGSAWGSISSTAAIYRYRFIAAGGETSVSGTDALSQTLAYLPGKEQVYLNGILLVRTTDYTATDGTSITGLAALVVSDILEIITFTAFSLATAIENTIIDAKGDLIVGTAADTVGRLAVGTDTYILSANSAEATGLQWIANDTGDIEGVVTGTDSGLSGGVTSGTATLRLKLEFDAETGTTYTLVAGNLNQLVTLDNASAITLTVPPSVFSAGDVINIAQIGAGQVTLAEGAGVTITSTGATVDAPALRAQYSSASIICTAADTFLVVGDIA